MKVLLTHFPSTNVDIHANGAFERYEDLQLCLITNPLQERDRSDSAAIISSMFKENLSNTNFWNLVPSAQYPILKQMSLYLYPLFDSTCLGQSGVATVDALTSMYSSSLTVEHLNNCMRFPVAKDTPNCNKQAEGIVSSTTLNFVSLFGWTTFQTTLHVFIQHFLITENKVHDLLYVFSLS